MFDNPHDQGTPTTDPALIARDPARDPAILAEIARLNREISITDEPIEGNICYWHGTPASDYAAYPPTADQDHVAKRVNFAELARQHRSMLEIGLNGGHSAIICLLANPALHFFAVDLCLHQYTVVAAAYLRRRFGRRFQFWQGDSRDMLPRLAVDYPLLRFDLIHVDGGHGADLAYADTSNALRFARAGAKLVFDDINVPHLDEILQAFIRMGYLAPASDRVGLVSTPLHEICEIVSAR
jgi:predicted O-methyltransferase YrrM